MIDNDEQGTFVWLVKDGAELYGPYVNRIEAEEMLQILKAAGVADGETEVRFQTPDGLVRPLNSSRMRHRFAEEQIGNVRRAILHEMGVDTDHCAVEDAGYDNK